MNRRVMVCGVLLGMSCGSTEEAPPADGVSREASELELASAAPSGFGFAADFADCQEFAGIGSIPVTQARAAVPPAYTLAGGGANAVVVVRVASCARAEVDGRALGRTLTAQVGLSLVGPDTTASINNYTWFYATNQPRLHARLQAAGLDATLTQNLSIALADGKLRIQSPLFRVEGTAIVPGPDAVQFIASWWENGRHGVVRSRTVFPAIRFGTASTALVAPPGSKLAQLLGSPSLTFAFLDSYNVFPTAHLEVRRPDSN